MDNTEKVDGRPLRMGGYATALLAVWTAILLVSALWNTYEEREQILALARSHARVAHQKDVTYRQWNTEHGGVYAPVTKRTQPNPLLNVAERDITTPSGKLLTLINPAYMTRQTHELAQETYGIHGHITSLNPIRPENAADPWEALALKEFESGASEVSSVEDFKGEPHMRLMRPLVTEKGCLKCHAEQGYREGDIRGGISVSIPMAPLTSLSQRHQAGIYAGHAFIWLVGMFGIGYGARRINQQMAERQRAEEEQRFRERLQGVIEMAGATCHELNQPMQVITGYVDLILLRMSENDPQYRRIREIKEQAERMARITSKLSGITKYVTRDYIDDIKIIDIDKASEQGHTGASGR